MYRALAKDCWVAASSLYPRRQASDTTLPIRRQPTVQRQCTPAIARQPFRSYSGLSSPSNPSSQRASSTITQRGTISLRSLSVERDTPASTRNKTLCTSAPRTGTPAPSGTLRGADHAYFPLQPDRKTFHYRLLHCGCGGEQLGARGAAVVDQHQGVALGHAGAPEAAAAQAARFDQLRRRDLVAARPPAPRRCAGSAPARARTDREPAPGS